MGIPFTIPIDVRIASQIMTMKRSNRNARISMVLGPCFTGEKYIHTRAFQTFFRRKEIIA